VALWNSTSRWCGDGQFAAWRLGWSLRTALPVLSQSSITSFELSFLTARAAWILTLSWKDEANAPIFSSRNKGDCVVFWTTDCCKLQQGDGYVFHDLSTSQFKWWSALRLGFSCDIGHVETKEKFAATRSRREVNVWTCSTALYGLLEKHSILFPTSDSRVTFASQRQVGKDAVTSRGAQQPWRKVHAGIRTITTSAGTDASPADVILLHRLFFYDSLRWLDEMRQKLSLILHAMIFIFPFLCAV